MPRIIDLFAGLGGIRLGFQEAMDVLGLETECVFSSEIKQYAIKAYKDFYGKDEVVNGDITQIDVVDIPDFDVLLAGFPCQPFSSAGVRKGFKDTRGTMFFESALECLIDFELFRPLLEESLLKKDRSSVAGTAP